MPLAEPIAQIDQPQIVILDDDPITLENLRRQWRHLDAELVLFENPQEAISYMATHSPTLIVVDLYMPRLDGIELLSQAEFEHYPVQQQAILHSAITPPQEILARANKLGVEFVTKDVLLNKTWISDKLANTKTNKKQ